MPPRTRSGSIASPTTTAAAAFAVPLVSKSPILSSVAITEPIPLALTNNNANTTVNTTINPIALNWKRDAIDLFLIFITCTILAIVALIGLYSLLPIDNTPNNNINNTDIQTNSNTNTVFQYAIKLANKLSHYTTTNTANNNINNTTIPMINPYYLIILGHGIIFLLLQTFAIPGTVILNLLAGILFDTNIGYLLCLIWNCIGQYCMYRLAQLKCRSILYRVISIDRLNQLKQRIPIHSNNNTNNNSIDNNNNSNNTSNNLDLLFYLTGLRLFPAMPQWLLTLYCADQAINTKIFILAVAIGLSPYNYLSVRAGALIQLYSSNNLSNEIFSRSQTIILAIIAILLILMGYWFNKRNKLKPN